MDASGVLPATSRNRKSENPDALDKELTTLTPAYLDCLLQSLENAYGYEGRVTHLGGQATAILFLKCLREKTNRQIVLNGGLHLSDYVTKVMKRLSDQSVDPKVVLEFLGHFAGRFGKLSAAGKVCVLRTTYAPLPWVPGAKPGELLLRKTHRRVCRKQPRSKDGRMFVRHYKRLQAIASQGCEVRP